MKEPLNQVIVKVLLAALLVVLVAVKLPREAQAYPSEQKQLLDILVDELVGLGDRRLWHVDDIVRLQPEILPGRAAARVRVKA